jgi:hypothetical protein
VGKYNPERDVTPHFTDTVRGWLHDFGEVFVVLRYLASAGNKDHCICRSHIEFLRLIEIVPVGTDIVVFQTSQVPLRGTCSTAFIEKALVMVPDGTEYLLVSMEPKCGQDPRIAGWMGETHAELKADLLDCLGQQVAFGTCPAFHEADNKFMISASKGGIDGPR